MMESRRGELLHVGRPNIGDQRRFQERVDSMVDRRWFTNNGPLVQEFESKLSECLGVKHCIAVCNATVGLQIAIRALNLDGEVIVPSFTFVATAHALQWLGITPVFCDIERHTHLIDPGRIEELITPRTSAILGVHIWGRTAAVEALEEIACKHGLELLFDAAHAFGCTRGGQMVGRFGACEVFSFHATKFLNSFEGGAIATQNDDLASKLRLMKNFGFVGYDSVDYVGTNGKMPEICAAMGLTNLEALGEFVEVNRRNLAAYRVGLGGLPGIRLLDYEADEHFNFQYVVVEVEEGLSGISRDALVRVLHENGVLARRYFYPGCHRMEPYALRYRDRSAHLNVTEEVCKKVLVLPTGTAVGPKEIDAVCAIVRNGIPNA